MSFNYDKLKKKNEAGEQWASYSDLFMVLSVVFLLLYVVASLRTGTHTLTQEIQKQEMQNRVQDLEQQIRVYNTLKDNYIEKQAAEKEKVVYENLMKKLELLQEENGEEASALRKKALENEKKKEALNQYQQIVRNIINANMLSKSRIKRRDNVIKDQKVTIKERDETIVEKQRDIISRDKTISAKEIEIANLDKEVARKMKIIRSKNAVIKKKQRILAAKQKQIKGLNKDIKVKKWIINNNKKKIRKIDGKLKREIANLKAEKKKRKISAKKYKQRLAAIRAKSEKEKAKLERRSKKAKRQLKSVQAQVAKANTQLKNANKTIEEQNAQKAKLNRQIASVNTRLKDASKTIQEQEAQKARLSREIASANEKLQSASEQIKAQTAQKAKLTKELATVKKRVDETQKQFQKRVKMLKKKVASVSSDLQKAKSKLNARKKLAKQIQKNFAKAGIKASVDKGTGDVILAFGKNYFDTGKAQLKGGMEQTLNKFVPIYAESLFQDPKIAKKIKSVDVVGFASPTYAGRYVNPSSLDPKDKKAIKYNLDLSYRRARSIFEHMFDTEKLRFNNQKQLLPLVKVSAKSFFTGSKGRMPASNMSRKEFCQKYDCKKEQRVIIRFDLND